MLGSFELFRASDDPAFDEEDARLMRDAVRIFARALRHGAVAPGRSGRRAADRRPTPAAWFHSRGG